MRIFLDTNSFKYHNEIIKLIDDLAIHDCNFNDLCYIIYNDKESLSPYITRVDENLGCKLLAQINGLVERLS